MKEDNVKYPEDCIKVLDKGFVRLVEHMGDDHSICNAARVSYQKGTKKVSDDKTLIRYLMRKRHTSPFEMCEFIFHARTPIFCARQWVRHRTASLNEMSGRYSEMPQLYYIPKEEDVTFQDTTNKQGGTKEPLTLLNIPNATEFVGGGYEKEYASEWKWSDEFKMIPAHAIEQYDSLLRTGMRRELARIVLPLNLYTEWYWKLDLHNLFHFLKLRLDSHAQYEMRLYAEAIYKLIKPIVPISCEAFEDYVLNAITLTAKDITALEELLDYYYFDCSNDPPTWDTVVSQIAKEYFTNKRERSEFVEKLKKIRKDK